MPHDQRGSVNVVHYDDNRKKRHVNGAGVTGHPSP